MKALFNGTCSHCGTFKPRCAKVYLRDLDARPMTMVFEEEETILCEDCREKFRGLYRVAEFHKN